MTNDLQRLQTILNLLKELTYEGLTEHTFDELMDMQAVVDGAIAELSTLRVHKDDQS